MNSEELKSVVELVAADVRRRVSLLSSYHGGDCLLHAKVGQQFLREEGVETRLVVGEAAWRIGNGDGDVIAHSRKCNTFAAFGSGMFHAWLEHDDHIIDFTTYTLPVKARLMDDVDGMKTKVLWCPEYLYVPKTSVSSFPEVRDKHAGLYHYHRNSALECSILNRGQHLDKFVETASLLRKVSPNTNVWVMNEHGDVTKY